MSVSHPTAIKVLERDGYTCVRCRGPYAHVHHRRPKRMGGTKRADTNAAVNLILLCEPCHRAVHAEGATIQGYLLADYQDPEMTMLLWRERWVYLTPDGDILGQESNRGSSNV